jgi:UDP-GlcNAc:undecaprenyl-phosphate GlcNAc-1-phosphate transferase
MALRELILIFLTALALGIGATFMARQVAVSADMVDRPGGHKKHRMEVPLLGGVAVYLAFLVSILVWGDRYHVGQLVSILVGASMMSFLGLWDDRRALPAWLKFVAQIAIATVLIMSGVQVQLFGDPLLNASITLFWVLYVTNAFNLLDNMDGLASGVAAIASGFFLVCAVLNGQYLVGALSAAMLGACLGFLYFNFNPAKIFMGDAGSLFIGFVLASIGIKLRFPANMDWVTWMVPVLILGLPIFDTALVSLSRLRRGVPPWQGGTDHTSHRLALGGRSTRNVVSWLYLIGFGFGVLGTVVSILEPVPAYLVGGAALVGAFFLGVRLERKELVSRLALSGRLE